MNAQTERRQESGWALATLVLANLVPLAGVYLWGWSLTDLLLLYWIENAVIGLYTVLTMLTSWPAGQALLPRVAGKLFFVPFFIVHYGMFWIGHGIFLQTFFGEGVRGFAGVSQNFFLGPVMEGLMRAEVLVWPLVAMLVSHGVSFVSNFLASGEFRTAAIGELMMRPYGRVVILHVTIVLGGFMAVLLGPSLGVLLLFVTVKIVADVVTHLRVHRRMVAVGPVNAQAS